MKLRDCGGMLSNHRGMGHIECIYECTGECAGLNAWEAD
jgi:hypothetical protein